MRPRIAVSVMFILSCCPLLPADELIAYPRVASITAQDLRSGWTAWQGITNVEGQAHLKERAVALHVDAEGTVWVGTSRGRLFSKSAQHWMLEAKFEDLQITGVATGVYVSHGKPVEGTVWLSTSDGILQLAPIDAGWDVTRYRIYYEGHPGFVSGAYVPGEDAVRIWGYVDNILVPPGIATYAPYVISKEHGLFAWGGYHGVWHHFLPHYWGGNSDWLDTRDLLPNRRPTCMIEDAQKNLWIGSENDGLLRMSAHARSFNTRSAEDNAKDGKEWARFRSDQLGYQFDIVRDVAPGALDGVWAALAGRDARRRCVARYAEQHWKTIPMPSFKRRIRGSTDYRQWRATPTSVCEPKPGLVFVGAEDTSTSRAALYRLDWEDQSFEPVPEVKYTVTKMEVAADRLWAISWWGVYSFDLGGAR